MNWPSPTICRWCVGGCFLPLILPFFCCLPICNWFSPDGDVPCPPPQLNQTAVTRARPGQAEAGMAKAARRTCDQHRWYLEVSVHHKLLLFKSVQKKVGSIVWALGCLLPSPIRKTGYVCCLFTVVYCFTFILNQLEYNISLQAKQFLCLKRDPWCLLAGISELLPLSFVDLERLADANRI